MMAAGNIWQMERAALKNMLDNVARYECDPQDLEAQSRGDGGSDADYEVWNDWAIVPVNGVLMKSVPKILQLFGFNSTSLSRLRNQVLKARKDDSVEGIFLDVESPGGSVKGTQQAADELWRARESGMPVHAYIEDLGASGGLYLASQADRVVANKGARVGSIGTYLVQYDFSEQAEREGIEVHVISNGELKGAGEPGSEITEEQLAHWQKIVDKYTDQFVEAVARGRGMDMDEVQELATGEVWLAEAALDNGLIDEISDYPGGESQMGYAAQYEKARAQAGGGGDPAAQEEDGDWQVVPYSRHEDAPLADKDAEWDADREMERADGEDYGQMVMAERNEGTDRNDVKLPCHRGSGEHALVFNGLTAVAGALNGARGGVDLPDDVQDRIYNGHMTREYERFDEEPPPRELSEEEFLAYCYAGKLLPPKEDGSMGDSTDDIELSDEQKKIVAREFLQDNPDAATEVLPEDARQDIEKEGRSTYREALNSFLAITGEEPKAVEALKAGKSADTLRQEVLEAKAERVEELEQKLEEARQKKNEDVFGTVDEPGGGPQDAGGDVDEGSTSGVQTREEAEERVQQVKDERGCTRAEAMKWLEQNEPQTVEAFRG